MATVKTCKQVRLVQDALKKCTSALLWWEVVTAVLYLNCPVQT